MSSKESESKPFNTTELPSSVPSPYRETPPPLPSNSKAVILRQLKRIDAFLSRLSLILSTPSGTDSLMRTLTYTLQFVASALHTVLVHRLESVVKTISESAAKVPLLPGESLVVALSYPSPTIAKVAPRVRVLSSAISDFRTFTRLWGLLGMYSWGKSLWLGAAPADPVLKACAWGQCIAYTAYQVLENRAFLAGKGIIPREGKLILRDWLWSTRCWMFGVALDFVRLGRVYQKWRIEDARSASGSEVVKSEEAVAKRAAEVSQWRSDLIVALANAPLTVHWSLEGGTLSDTSVGFLGMVAGLVGFSQRWKATEAQVKK